MTFDEANREYPFDPAHRDHPERFAGLAKLRAFEAEAMRRNVYDLWANIDARRAKPAGPKDPVPWDQRPRRETVAPKHWNETDRDDEGRPF